MTAVPGPIEEVRGFTRIWWLVLLAGILGVVAGIVVLVVPDISLITLAQITGIFLLVDGIFEVVASLGPGMEHRGLMALIGVVTAVIGVLLIRHPIAGVVATALLLGFWLLTFGIIRLIDAFSMPTDRGWSLLVAGLEIVGGIVIVAAPDIGVATLALLVGLAFIFRGLATCMLGWGLRKVHSAMG